MKDSQNSSNIQKVSWEQWSKSLDLHEIPVFICKIQVPVLPPSCWKIRRINRYYQKLSQAWQIRWIKRCYPAACQHLQQCQKNSLSFLPWAGSVVGTAHLLEPNLYSVCLTCCETHGDGRPILSPICDLWDLSQGKPLSPAHFFPTRRSRRALTALAEEAICTQQQRGLLFLSDDWQTQLSHHQLHLTPDGLTLCYPQCTIAPAAEGIPVIPIPSPQSF